MSIRLMDQVFNTPMDTPGEKLFLLAVADYADDQGNNVYPSKSTLAKKTGLDVRTVERITAKYVGMGVLVVVQVRLQLPTIYRLDVSRIIKTKSRVKPQDRPDATPRQDAGTRPETGIPPASDQGTPGVVSESPRREATLSVIEPSGEPSEEPIPLIPLLPEWAADWPVLHVKDGDYQIQEPYASDPRVFFGIIEWIKRRLEDKKKGMPTVYGMKHKNCGWWDKYCLDAVVCAIEAAASDGWQGIIEDVARKWKPPTGPAASVQSNSVQSHMQSMHDRMVERRRQMVSAAVADGKQRLNGHAASITAHAGE